MHDDGERLVVYFSGVVPANTEKLEFVRADAASHADVEPSVGKVVEHADFLDQTQRMVQGQDIHHWAEADTFCPLRDSGEENARRRRHGDRCRVMFGQVIDVKSGVVIGLDQPQAVVIGLDQPQAVVIGLAQFDIQAAVEMVEDAELDLGHAAIPATPRPALSPAIFPNTEPETRPEPPG